MTMVGFSGLSFEDQMLEFERQARIEAQRREEEDQRIAAERAAAIAAARAREEAAARIAAQQESDRLARIAAAQRAARDRANAIAAARAREEDAARIAAAQESSRLARIDEERRNRLERERLERESAAGDQAPADRRAADIAARRARDEDAALEASRLESSGRSPRPPRTPRLAEVLAGATPEAAARPAGPTTAGAPAGPIALGGLEMAAASLQAEADVRRRNDALRRAFDVVPGGPQVRAQVEALVAKSSPRPTARAIDLVEERSRDVENRAIAATLPMGEEAFDSFTRERDLALQNQELLRALPMEARPDEAPTSGARPALLSPGAEPVSDFEAFASFSEGERRQTDAVDAVQRAKGAARAADVAADLEEQSALDAAFRREILGEVGGADLIRAMDAEAADLEAAQRREMLADPGGAAVLRAQEPERPPEVPVVRLSQADREAALMREVLADPGGTEIVRRVLDGREPAPLARSIEARIEATEGVDLVARNSAIRREMVADPVGADFVAVLDLVLDDILELDDAGVRSVVEDFVLSGPLEFPERGRVVPERLVQILVSAHDRESHRDGPGEGPPDLSRAERNLLNLYPADLVQRAERIAQFELRGDQASADALRDGRPLPPSRNALFSGVAALGQGLDRTHQGILGFMTAPNPLESIEQFGRGVTGKERFSGEDLGIIRHLPERFGVRSTAGRFGEELVNPLNLALAARGMRIGVWLARQGKLGRLASKLVSPVASSDSFAVRLAAEAAFSTVVGGGADWVGSELAARGLSPRDQMIGRLIAGAAIAGAITLGGRAGQSVRQNVEADELFDDDFLEELLDDDLLEDMLEDLHDVFPEVAEAAIVEGAVSTPEEFDQLRREGSVIQ